MVFSSPLFLWALSLTLIPIAIHLFQFRRYKRLYFPDISLLKEVKSQSQTKNQLKHLLILLARILFIVLLVLAFCEPKIPSINGQSEDAKYVSIYIDNSFSMEAETERGPLLQEASRLAYEIASNYPKGVMLQLITNDFTAQQKRFSDLSDFTAQLDLLQISPKHKVLSEVFGFIDQSLREENNAKSNVYLISDFKNILDSSISALDSNYQLTLVPLHAALNENISIDSVWVNSPIIQKNRELELHFRIQNHGSKTVYDAPVQVSIEGKETAASFITLEGESYLDTSLIIIPEAANDLSGTVSLEDMPITFDNAYYFSISVQDKIRVAEIRGDNITENTPFQKLFSGSHFDFTSFTQDAIIQDSLSEINFLVLNQLDHWNSGLKALAFDQLAKGNNLVFVMPEKANASVLDGVKDAFGFDIQQWDTANVSVNAIANEHYTFKDVFESQPENLNYPFTRGYYALNTQSFSNSIATLFNQKPLIASSTIELGEVFLISAPLKDQFTNLHRHALFVPFLMNASNASGVAQKLSYSIETDRIPMSISDEYIEVIKQGDSLAFIPSLTYDGILMNNQIQSAGNYILQNTANTILSKLSFNYDRDESSVTPITMETMEQRFAALGQQIRTLDTSDSLTSEGIATADTSTELWPFFVFAALLLLLFETLLLKRFS